MSITQKLLSIQTQLKAPKGQFNSFGKYNYRNCEDILEAVKPHLSANKCALTIGDELIPAGERYYIKATVTLYDVESEERISNTAFAREEESKKGMDGSQITGAASSYARKYALNGLFAIDDTKDSDSTNTYGAVTKPAKAVTCVECEAVIKPRKKNGEVVTAEAIAKGTGGLCITCYKAQQEAQDDTDGQG